MHLGPLSDHALLDSPDRHHFNQSILFGDRTMRKIFLATMLMSATALLNVIQVSADMSGPFDGPSVDVQEMLEDVRDLLTNEEYEKAIKELDAIIENEPENADAWNLTGFSERKLGNLDSAEVAYKKALQLDPEHKGALEYQGELFLQKGQRGNALVNQESVSYTHLTLPTKA